MDTLERALVAALIPVRNEQGRVGSVVSAAFACPVVESVLVIANGCTDGTAQEAAEAGADVLELPGAGKGEAILAGFLSTSADVIVLLDGDLRALEPKHIEDLVHPILRSEAYMTCGILDGRVRTRLTTPLIARHPAFTLSGQRAMKRVVLESVNPEHARGYKIETALNEVCKARRFPVLALAMDGVVHVRREQKLVAQQAQSIGPRSIRGVLSQISCRAAKYRTIGAVSAYYLWLRVSRVFTGFSQP